MPFVKLDCGIRSSSLWLDCPPEARLTFITMLTMAEPFVLEAPEEQLPVDSLNPTGWVVPAGAYGMTRATAPAITREANLPAADVEAALRILESPDPKSRSRQFEGRRVARIDGGYLVLNFADYRERDYTAAERMRRYRERAAVTRNVTPRYVCIEHKAEAKAEAENGTTDTPLTPLSGGNAGGRKNGNGAGTGTARELDRLQADPVLAGIADAWSVAFHRPGRQLGVLRAARTALAGGYEPDALRLVIRCAALAREAPDRFPDRGLIRWAVEHGKAGDPSYLLRPSALDRLIPEAEAWDAA